MTRAHHRHAQPGASGRVGAVHHKRSEAKQKPSYKVVFEEIAGKKKLKVRPSFSTEAPTGYTFIPAGDPQLTNRCKKIAKDEQITVFSVSTSKFPHLDLSREVHRIGYHFSSTTVEQACMSLGITLTASGRVMQSNFAFIDDQLPLGENQDRRQSRRKQKGKARHASPSFDITLSQAVIDTQAREAIRDLFPNIPRKDLHDIIGRAFQKGKGLVGTVGELSLVRRAQLAVTAHIRHMYTDYDRLLKSMKWAEARKQVQQSCLDMLVQWRGDDDDDGEIDDILREVIIIPDDEEGDMPPTAEPSRDKRRSQSVELISSNELNTQTVSSESEDEGMLQDSEITLLPHRPSLRYDRHRLEQMGAHRHRIWEEALDRRRKIPDMPLPSRSRYPPPAAPTIRQSQMLLPAQRLQEPRRQPYELDSAGQPLHTTTKYTRLIPLSYSDDYRAFEAADPHRRVLTKPADQDVLPPQSNKALPRYNVSNTNRPLYLEPGDKHHHVPNPRQYLTQSQDGNSRSVNTQDFHHQARPPFDPRSVQEAPRWQAEMILPSIERDPSNVGNLQSLQPDQLQDTRRFTQAHEERILAPQQRTITKAHIDGHKESYIDKRNVMHDQRQVYHGSQDTVLIPLYDETDYTRKRARPPEAVHYDERIIQLPPRDLGRYEENNGIPRTRSHYHQLDNEMTRRTPGNHSKDRSVHIDSYERPRSPSAVLPGPVLGPQSLNSFQVVHAHHDREISDLHSLNHHNPEVFKNGYRTLPLSNATTEHSNQDRKEKREMRDNLAHSAFGALHPRDVDGQMNGNGMQQRMTYIPLQATSEFSYPSLGPRSYAMIGSPREGSRQEDYGSRSQNDDMRLNRFEGDGARSIRERTLNNDKYHLPQRHDNSRENPFGRQQNHSISLPRGDFSSSHAGTAGLRPFEAYKEARQSRRIPEGVVVLD